MNYHLSNDEQIKMSYLKLHLPSLMGGQLNKIIKTDRFESSYKSSILKQPLIINELSNHSDFNTYKLTFRRFLAIEDSQIVFIPTPNDLINHIINDAILKFNLFKSFVYTEFRNSITNTSAGFETLKFDLILLMDVYADRIEIKEIHIKSYYFLTSKQAGKFKFFIKERGFLTDSDMLIKYNTKGEMLPCYIKRFINIVEGIWGYKLDFNNLDVKEMKTITEMLVC